MAELVAEKTLKEAEAYEVKFVDVDSREAYERGKIDINFFAALLLPTVMVSPLPDFYVGIFNIIVNRKPEQIGKILRFALGLPRAHAKTTFIKILICWLIVYDKYSFITVVCANDDLAQNLIGDISEALGSENAEAIYGHWERQLSVDNKEEKKALYHGRSVIIKAKGANGALRGLNIKHKRPDLIFYDDAQTKECDESPTESAKFRRWLVASFKLIAPITQTPNRLIIYVGNMYSEECILFQLKNNPSWVSLVTGAIKENGEPLWPELHSLEELMESYFHDEAMGEADVWFAEVMNDPVSRATSLLHAALGTSDFDTTQLPDGVFITLDPAGFRLHSDDNVIVVHYVHNGRGHIAAIETSAENKALTDPEQIIIRTLQLALHHGASLIGVEDVGYQQTLLFWFSKYVDEWKIKDIQIVPLKPAGRSKEARIRLFVAELYANNYALTEPVKATYVWQAMKYKIGKKDNKDDILDACAYGLDVRNDYWHLVKNMKSAGQWLVSDASVVSNNTPF